MAQCDDNVARSIWNGKLPIQVTLAEEDSRPSNGMTWQPLFCEVPRCSYLPLLMTRLIAHTTDLGLGLETVREQDVWFDYDGAPLKWHYPVGLLFDLLNADPTVDLALPWRIMMHTSGFPTKTLLQNPSANVVKDTFMSMIKEADFLMHGSIKKVMNLSKRDQTLLWDALLQDHAEDYQEIHQKLVFRPDDTPPRHLPLRLYLPNPFPSPCTVVQDLVPFCEQDGKPLTLGQALARVLPDTDPSSSRTLISHGIPLPTDTPVDWAFRHLSFPDHFLHLIVAPKET